MQLLTHCATLGIEHHVTLKTITYEYHGILRQYMKRFMINCFDANTMLT